MPLDDNRLFDDARRHGWRRGPALAITMAASIALFAGPAGGQEPDPGPDDDAYLQVVDITFPTDPRARFSDDYAAPRGGGSRVHKSTDLIGEKGWPLYAAVDGTVCSINGIDGPMPHWGYAISVCDDEGRRFAYLHVNNDSPGTDDGQGGPEYAYAPGMRLGVEVERGQLIAWMGDSGNAENTVDHLHFEIHVDEELGILDPYGDNRINPYASLVDALDRGDVSDDDTLFTDPVLRVAGEDRQATAVQLSREAHESADTIVVAPALTPGEAIVAGPLAHALDAPVLTTSTDELDPRVVAEARRLGATDAVLVGDFAQGITDTLVDAGFTDVTTIVGADVFETSALVADALWERQDIEGGDGPAADVDRAAIVAKGDDPEPSRTWPDSLMASYLGSGLDLPVLLVDHDRVPASTLARLEGLGGVTIVGGAAAVDDRVTATIRAALADGATVERHAGPDRYATALAVTDDLLDRDLVEHGRLWVATGQNWPDAATAGSVVARAGEPLVLVAGGFVRNDVVATWMRGHADVNDAAAVIGGRAAVVDDVVVALGRRLYS